MRKAEEDYDAYMDNLAAKVGALLHGERLDDAAFVLAATLATIVNQMPESQVERMAPKISDLMNQIANRRHEEETLQ
jgi:hypothetical protein